MTISSTPCQIWCRTDCSVSIKSILLAACILAAIAVMFGAFGAHALKERLTAEQLASWETGVRYQFYHAMGLFALAWLLTRGVPVSGPAALMLVGTILFSGSIYLLSLSVAKSVLWPVTPLGGLCLIASWLWTLVAVAKSEF